METQTVNLKELLLFIKENKNISANLILDEGCSITVADRKPLIKVINYVMNYLEQFTEQPLEISLDLFPDECSLTFLAYSAQEELPALSEQLAGALQDYRATLDLSHEPGRFVQIRIHFQK